MFARDNFARRFHFNLFTLEHETEKRAHAQNIIGALKMNFYEFEKHKKKLNIFNINDFDDCAIFTDFCLTLLFAPIYKRFERIRNDHV